MSFLSPLFLALLGLAALIVALHIRRRRTITVPSVQIWRRLQGSETQSVRRLVLPPPNLLMALQIAALVAIVAALAQPLLSSAARVDHLVVVIDGSARMHARPGGESVFERAREEVAELVATGTGAQRLSVVRMDIEPRVMSARQDGDARLLAEQVRAIEPGDGTPDWTAVGHAISRLVRPDEALRILVYSSQTMPETVQDRFAQATIDHPLAGTSIDDIAFTADLVEGAQGWQLEGEARMLGAPGAAMVTVRYSAAEGGAPLTLASRELAPSDPAPDGTVEATPYAIELDLPGPGLVEVAMTGADIGHARRTFFEILPQAPTLDVLYIGMGDQPFVQALQSVPGVRVFQAPALPVDIETFGLVVVDDVAVTRVPETHTLWIAGGRVESEDAPERISLMQPDTWQLAHPLMGRIAWVNLALAEAAVVTPPQEAEILLASGDRPLIAARTTPNGREVWLAFDPGASNWPAQPSLPVFAANLVDWLGLRPAPARLGQRCALGTPCRVDARLIGGTITRLQDGVGPREDQPEAEPAPTRPLASATLDTLPSGLYRLENGARAQTLVIAPGRMVEPASGDDTAAVRSEPGFLWSAWPWLAALALLILVVEGILAGRGTERFLHRSSLAASNPLSGKRRWLLGLRVMTIAMISLAILNAPLPWPSYASNVVMILSPEDQENRADDRPALARAAGRHDLERLEKVIEAEQGALVARLTDQKDAQAAVAARRVLDEGRRIAVEGHKPERQIDLDARFRPAPDRPRNLAAG